MFTKITTQCKIQYKGMTYKFKPLPQSLQDLKFQIQKQIKGVKKDFTIGGVEKNKNQKQLYNDWAYQTFVSNKLTQKKTIYFIIQSQKKLQKSTTTKFQQIQATPKPQGKELVKKKLKMEYKENVRTQINQDYQKDIEDKMIKYIDEMLEKKIDLISNNLIKIIDEKMQKQKLILKEELLQYQESEKLLQKTENNKINIQNYDQEINNNQQTRKFSAFDDDSDSEESVKKEFNPFDNIEKEEIPQNSTIKLFDPFNQCVQKSSDQPFDEESKFQNMIKIRKKEKVKTRKRTNNNQIFFQQEVTPGKTPGGPGITPGGPGITPGGPIQWQIEEKDIHLIGTSAKVHYYRCDGCKKAPIFGTRYHCMVCNDFDFCNDCYKEKEHPHKFEAIESNKDFNVKVYKKYEKNVNVALESLQKLKQKPEVIVRRLLRSKAIIKPMPLTIFNLNECYQVYFVLLNSGKRQWPSTSFIKKISNNKFLDENDCSDQKCQLDIKEQYQYYGSIKASEIGKGIVKWRMYYIDPQTNKEVGFGPIIKMNVEVKEKQNDGKKKIDMSKINPEIKKKAKFLLDILGGTMEEYHDLNKFIEDSLNQKLEKKKVLQPLKLAQSKSLVVNPKEEEKDEFYQTGFESSNKQLYQTPKPDNQYKSKETPTPKDGETPYPCFFDVIDEQFAKHKDQELYDNGKEM